MACAIQAEERARHLGAAGADESGKAQDFPGPEAERYVGEPGRTREPGDAEEFLAGLRARVRRKVLVELPADHHLDERRPVDLGDGLRRHVSAVPQHGDGVAQQEDFFEAVAHVDAGHAALAKPADDRVEPLGFVLRQAARRLVEDDQPRALPDRRGNLQHLLLADGQRPDGPRDVEAGIDRREHRLSAAPHLALRDKAARRRQAPEAQVLGHRQVFAERELLVDHRDARLQGVGRAGKPDGLAADA